VAPFAGLVRPVFAQIGYLAAFFGFMAGGAGNLLHVLMLFVREGDIAVFGRQYHYGIVGGGSEAGAKQGQGDRCNNPFHGSDLLFLMDLRIHDKRIPVSVTIAINRQQGIFSSGLTEGNQTGESVGKSKSCRIIRRQTVRDPRYLCLSL
jgi:hypothetical protein